MMKANSELKFEVTIAGFKKIIENFDIRFKKIDGKINEKLDVSRQILEQSIYSIVENQIDELIKTSRINITNSQIMIEKMDEITKNYDNFLLHNESIKEALKTYIEDYLEDNALKVKESIEEKINDKKGDDERLRMNLEMELKEYVKSAIEGMGHQEPIVQKKSEPLFKKWLPFLISSIIPISYIAYDSLKTTTVSYVPYRENCVIQKNINSDEVFKLNNNTLFIKEGNGYVLVGFCQ